MSEQTGTQQIYGNVGIALPEPDPRGTQQIYGNVGFPPEPVAVGTQQIYGNVEVATVAPPAVAYATGSAQIFTPSPDAVEYIYFNVGVNLPAPDPDATEYLYFNVGVDVTPSMEAAEYLYFNVNDLAALLPHIWWVRPDAAREGWQIKIVGMGLQNAQAALGPDAMVVSYGTVASALDGGDPIIDGDFKTTNVAHQYILAYVPMNTATGTRPLAVSQPDGIDVAQIEVVDPFDNGVTVTEHGRVILTTEPGTSAYAGTPFHALSPDGRWGFAVGVRAAGSGGGAQLMVWSADMTQQNPTIESRWGMSLGTDPGDAAINRYRLFQWGTDVVLLYNQYNPDGLTWDTALRDINHTVFGRLSSRLMATTDGQFNTKNFDFDAFSDQTAHLMLRTGDDRFLVFQITRGLNSSTWVSQPTELMLDDMIAFGGILAVGRETALVAWESTDALLVSTVDVMTGQPIETVRVDDPEGLDASLYLQPNEPTLHSSQDGDSYCLFRVGDLYAIPYYYASASHEYHITYLDLSNGLRVVQDITYAVETPGVDKCTQVAVVADQYFVMPNSNLFSVIDSDGGIIHAFDNFPENNPVNFAPRHPYGLVGVFLDTDDATPVLASWNVQGLQFDPPRYPAKKIQRPEDKPWASDREDLDLAVAETGRWR